MDDLDCVMQIWLESNLQAHDFIPESYWRGQYDNVKEMIPAAEVYVCEARQGIVGFIGLVDHYIAGLFVAPGFQSNGVGKRLLDYAKALKPELSLNVYQQNRRAVKFYQREGLVIDCEDWDEDTREKEFRMKHLNPDRRCKQLPGFGDFVKEYKKSHADVMDWNNADTLMEMCRAYTESL